MLAPVTSKLGQSELLSKSLVAQLNALLLNPTPDDDAVHHALNGGAYETVRQTYDLTHRRTYGIFFSSPKHARRLVTPFAKKIAAGEKIVDPACGAGDLLLQGACSLSLRGTLEKTIEHWGKQLHGYDLDPLLIRITKLRLILLARTRGGFKADRINVADTFPHIAAADTIKSFKKNSQPNLIILNPPFGPVSTPVGTQWTSGNVSAAALFMDAVTEKSNSETMISALLPEVLRCGTRYGQWWKSLTSKFPHYQAVGLGQFDRWTDIDVFHTTLNSTRSTRYRASGRIQSISAEKARSKNNRIASLFNVRVGCVVPHRDENRGKWTPYITTRNCGPWAEITPTTKRRTTKTTFLPPFVVIRRTSRPGDTYRAVGSLIQGKFRVAVENHLLVLTPKSRRLSDCRELIKYLKATQVSDYLNRSIRCRHLTVASVAAIPWARN